MCRLCLFLFITVTLFQRCSKKDATSLPSINDANNKNTGSSGKDLLTSVTFTSIKIEIQYMPGFAPDAASINNLTSFLNSLVNKPAGISVVQKQIATGGKSAYSINDIASVEQNNREFFNTSNQVAVYVLITDGTYTDPNVLGVAYRNTSLCLFVSGHSHILKIMYDDKLNCLHINPGAAGKQGWQKVRTIIRFAIDSSDIKNCEVIELN